MTFAWWHILILLVPMLPTFWSIWDIWRSTFQEYNQKVLWLVIVVFIPVLGGLAYIFIGRKKHGAV